MICLGLRTPAFQPLLKVYFLIDLYHFVSMEGAIVVPQYDVSPK